MFSEERVEVNFEGTDVRAGSFNVGSTLLGRDKEFEALAARRWALGSGYWVFLCTELHLSVCLSGQLWGWGASLELKGNGVQPS